MHWACNVGVKILYKWYELIQFYGLLCSTTNTRFRRGRDQRPDGGLGVTPRVLDGRRAEDGRGGRLRRRQPPRPRLHRPGGAAWYRRIAALRVYKFI